MNISAREDEPKTGTMNASDEGEAQEESANSLCFHGACVRSAVQTLNAVYSAFTSQELSTKNPFVMSVSSTPNFSDHIGNHLARGTELT